MCGRYLLKPKTVEKVFEELDLEPVQSRFQLEEVYPSADCLVLEDSKKPVIKKWGLDKGWNSKPLINSRLETLQAELSQTKPKRFLNDFKYRRILIPVSGFYEWDKEKNKYLYSESNPMYLAGISNGDTFSIITQEANEQVQHIHNRQPLIIPLTDIDNYYKSENIDHLLSPNRNIVFNLEVE